MLLRPTTVRVAEADHGPGPGGRVSLSTLDMPSGGCRVCGSARPPGPSGEPVHPGPGRLAPGRAAPGRQLPAAGGGSRLGPAADPCSAGRTLHRTCRAQILRVAADEKQTAFIFTSLKGHYSYVTAVF